ncbi:hypothetical protein [Microvirga rosea]|uniref:hypothetical protein n=1 Tax=Microvirga rosea TaxID=2715425 RepID=UPI001D09ED74|nr:hypothetical protein [Microvirga rosea]
MPNIQILLNNSKDKDIIVTDNPHSKNLIPGNQAFLDATIPRGQAGHAQVDNKPPMIFINPQHWKDKVKIFVHEILHHLYLGLAGGASSF